MKLNAPKKLLKNIKRLISILKIEEIKQLTVRYANLQADVAGGVEEISEGKFDMVINMRHSSEMVKKTLCHEMVHVQQMCAGKLKTIITEINGVQTVKDFWNGVETSGQYETLPWEIEAFKLEGKLFKKLAK